MKKQKILLILTIVLISGLSVVLYKLKKENELSNQIKKIDSVLENYFTNYLKCDKPETIEQYKSMIKHYNLRVIRMNRLRNEKNEVLNEEQEIKKLNNFCNNKGK